MQNSSWQLDILVTELGIELCKPCISDMQIPRPHSADMI
jgi:hypothetical protein